MRRLAMIALWLAATSATTAIAYIAVSAAGAEVTNRPLTQVVATNATFTTNPSAPTSTAVIATTSPQSTSATAATGTTTSTVPSASASTSPTTAPASPWQQTTITSVGGLVVVSYRSGEVRLESVAPTPGFSYEIEETGPSRVEVEFISGDVEARIRVRWDGGLVTEIDEDS